MCIASDEDATVEDGLELLVVHVAATQLAIAVCT